MSAEVHMNENRDLSNSLVGFSEDSKYEDISNFKKTVNDSWNEAVVPWKAVVSHPKYYPHQVSYIIKRKSKAIDSRVPDWQRTSFADGELKQIVRCVNDELEDGPYLYWKGMVEQVTYSLDKKDWFTVNKKQPEQVSMSWQSKRYQKELKRQLKRDFESKTEKKETAGREQEENRELMGTEFTLEKSNHNTERSRQRHRAKSTKSPDISKRHQTDEDGYVVPEIKSAPLPGDLYKSRSDLYIENISLRISVLEQEIANDTRLRKIQEDVVRPLFRPKVKDKGMERDITPKPYKKESLPEEVFAAKSVGNKDIKLSDKLTPVSRISTADSKSSPITHLKYTTTSGSDAASINLPTIDLEKTLNSYKMAIENTRQSLLTTLNGKQISRRTTITSKNYNAPTTITICDSGDAPDKATLPQYVRPAKGEKRVRDKRDTVNGVAGLLPGIAGKRLEVPTTTHRWL